MFLSNNDGVISIEDESFGLIKILKGDGELIGLEEAGIVSINLNTNSVNEVDENGNTLVSSGSFVREDGSIGSLGDFNLVVDKMDSFAVEWVDESEEVSKLPDVMGLGMVYSLHQAMMRDESGVLKGLVEEFIKVEGEVRKKEILKDILYKWTGADDVLVSDGGYHYDGKKLWVIEKFVGEEFKGINNDGHPNIWAAPLLDDVYNKIIEYVYYQLMIQCDGMIKNIYNMLELEYDFESNEVRYNFDKVIGYIDNELVKDEAMGIGKLLEATQIFKALGIDKQEGYERYFEHFNSLKEEYGGLLNAIGKNVINGTDEDDNIEGTGGADAVFAGDGNDIIYTRQGDDLVYGGGGDDVIDVCEGNDVVYGGDGNDSIIAGDGNDTVYGESGNDTINAGKGNDVVYGGDGNDSILGGEGNDLIYGEDGDDYINPGNGNNTVYGGNGNDTIKVSSTGNGSSYFDGGDGNDRIETMDGSNTVIGGKGDDYLYSGNRSDIRYYYGGHETFIYNLGDGNDTIENWRGNDVIEFGEGISLDNILFSGEGNDLIVRFKDNEGSIRIKYALSDSLYRVESFRFNDGSVLSYDEVLKIKNTQDKIVSIETKYIETKTNADLMEGLDKIDDSIGLTISDSDINKIIQDMTAYNTAEDGMISYGEDVNKEKELMMLVNS